MFGIKLFPRKTYTYLEDIGDRKGTDSYPIDCLSVWLNRNSVFNRLDGGQTGFFRQFKYLGFGVYILHGPEMHGIVIEGTGDRFVQSVENSCIY